jgi:hypothetical protein
MMPLQAIAYCSRVVPGITVEQIEELVRDATVHNLIGGVTGVLLCDGTNFLQYIEGPEDGLLLSYSRILNATSHMSLVELGRRRGALRAFPYWSMRWIPVETPDLRITASSDWKGLARRRPDSMFQVPTGVDRLAAIVRPYLD